MHCTDYKPMIFQMHLLFNDAPLAGKLQEKNIEIISKLNDYESNNIRLKSSYNAATYSIQQLESKVKTLKDGIQAKDTVINELQDRIEILEAFNQYLSKKYCDYSADVGTYSLTNENNCTNNYNKKSNQQQPIDETTNDKQIMSLNDIGKRNCYTKNSYNATEVVELMQTTNKCNDENCDATNDNKRQHTTLLATDEKTQEIYDDTPPSNSVLIENYKSSDTSLDTAITNVIALGQRMDLRITSNQIHNIVVYERNPPFLTYFVQFGNKKLKEAFLKKSHLLKNFRRTKFLTIS